MRLIPRTERNGSGWWRSIHDGRPVAWMRCPGCGTPGLLDDHQVKQDGTLDASVVCGDDCGFHEQARLLGWLEAV